MEENVNHRICAGWMKWWNTLGVFYDYDRKVSLNLKGKFDHIAIRLVAMLYGIEC